MKNPWESIPLEDYENHMKFNSIRQLPILADIMQGQFQRYQPHSAMILGVAGGNGLQHAQACDLLYGIDINADYLAECRLRYANMGERLRLLQIDLTQRNKSLPHVELLLANLLIEYVGYACFIDVVKEIQPPFVSCCLQVNDTEAFVSISPYLHAFDALAQIHHELNETELINQMSALHYTNIYREMVNTSDRKHLVCLDFEKRTDCRLSAIR